MSILNEAIAKITAQQPKERTAVWMVGEQLKDMLRAEPELAELVAQDLEVAAMSLVNCEKKIKEFSDKNKPKSANCFCVPPVESDRIIREFYGLPTKGEKPGPQRIQTKEETPVISDGLIDLSAYF